MKNILAPTDFSPSSLNAINYAVEMARHTGAKLTLLYVTHTPPVSIELPVVYDAPGVIEKEGLEKLEKIRQGIVQGTGRDLDVACVCVGGYAVDRIYDHAIENSTDLVIMGMQGAGYLSEKLVGSITTSLLRKAKFPVMIINEKVRFRTPKKIALACDYKPMGTSVLAPLKELAALFGSNIHCLHVCPARQMAAVKQQVADGLLPLPDLTGLEYTLHYKAGDYVAEGIMTFIDETEMQLLVMTPREHSLLEAVFNEPETKKMAFKANIPMLSLHA